MRLGIAVVPPGKTGTVENVSGQLEEHTQAVLRVYRGKDLLQRERLEIKLGIDRQDVVQRPGDIDSSYTITRGI